MNVYFKLEYGQLDRVSDEYGPYPFVQLTYDELRIGPDGVFVAAFVGGVWQLRPELDPQQRTYSDVVIYGKDVTSAGAESTPAEGAANEHDFKCDGCAGVSPCEEPECVAPALHPGLCPDCLALDRPGGGVA